LSGHPDLHRGVLRTPYANVTVTPCPVPLLYCRTKMQKNKRPSALIFLHWDYTLEVLFMHLAQAKILLPELKRTHWRLGFFLTLEVGLYLPLSFTRVTPIADFFPQIVQIFSMHPFYHHLPFFAICDKLINICLQKLPSQFFLWLFCSFR